MASVVRIFALYALVVVSVNAASIRNYARINSGEELVSSIASDCFSTEVFSCINERVLNFLNNLVGVGGEESRAMGSESVEEAIYHRIGKILATNELKLELPRSMFQGTSLVYRPDIGFDVELPKDEARGLLLKKKLFLPILLLLKLKMKALMPIIVALVGLKATKALILSKIAIKLVLGFLIYTLYSKFSGMKMSMMPMMPMMPSSEPPMSAYGAPPASTPASSYEPSWEAGGPYARVWDTAASPSAQNLAYSAYYPSSSNSASSSSGSSQSGSTSASSYS